MIPKCFVKQTAEPTYVVQGCKLLPTLVCSVFLLAAGADAQDNGQRPGSSRVHRTTRILLWIVWSAVACCRFGLLWLCDMTSCGYGAFRVLPVAPANV